MFLPVGPGMPESQELIDISGEKMRVVAAFPSLPEPHDAVFIHRKVLENVVIQTHQLEATAVKLGEEKVVRKGIKVDVFMTCIRSKSCPKRLRSMKAQYVHLTNVRGSGHDPRRRWSGVIA
jgi:nitrous-oxide reductase